MPARQPSRKSERVSCFQIDRSLAKTMSIISYGAIYQSIQGAVKPASILTLSSFSTSHSPAQSARERRRDDESSARTRLVANANACTAQSDPDPGQSPQHNFRQYSAEALISYQSAASAHVCNNAKYPNSFQKITSLPSFVISFRRLTSFRLGIFGTLSVSYL